MLKKLRVFFLTCIGMVIYNHSTACTPYSAPSVAAAVVGTDLILTVTSNTTWGCTYEYEAEIQCLSMPYTGVPTFPAPASGTATGFGSNYPTQTIDISGYCPGAYKIRVREKVTYYGGGGPWSAWSADFNFTVPGATLTVAADADPASICFPGSTDLTATPSSACGAVTYSWDNGGGPGQVVTVSPAGTTTYTVTATDATSCVTATASVTVTSLPAAIAGVADVAPLEVCDGNDITLSLAGETGTIQWQSGPTSVGPWTDIPGATTNSEVVGPITAGDDLFFQAVVTSCGSEISNVVSVTVNPNPVITAPDDFSVCDGTTVTITGTGAVGYAWTGGVVDGTPFTPAVGTTTYTVTGTDVNGCQGTDDVAITVFALPVIDAGADLAGCDDGSLVTLNGAGGVSYVWTGGITDGVAFAPSVGTTTYTVTGTDANGCENTDAVDVTVYANPIITAPADFSVCEGTTVTITGAGAVAYAWTGGIVDGTPFVPPVGTTTYTVTGTDANGCVGTDDVDITVFALPVIDAGLDVAICDGESVTLSGSGGDSYAWPGGVVDGVPFTPAVGTYSYTMVGTDANGCQNTDDLTLTVNALPVIAAGADVTVCDGDPVTLNGAGGVSYVWDGGVVDGTPFVPAVGTTTYTVTGTDANGCENTDGVDVTVNPLDDPSFAYTSATFCITGGDENPVIAGLAGGSFSYVTTGGGPTLNLNPATGTITMAGTDIGSYDVTYTTVGAAGSLCPQTSTFNVTITNSPVADFFIDDYCANVGDPVPTFIGTGSGGVFSGPGGLVIDPTTGEIDLDASTPGTYTVTNTIDLAGCATVVYTDDMTIFDIPTATISGTTTICVGDALPDLTIDVIGGTGPYTVGYAFESAPQPPLAFAGATTTISGAAIGTYDLSVVTDANGCVGTITGETATIDEFPVPVMDPIPDYSVCANENLIIGAFSSSLGGDTYDWTNTTGTDVGFGLSGAGTIGSFTGTNAGAADMTVTIDVTPTSANGCVGLPESFTVTIHPLPNPGLMPDVTQGCAPLTVNFSEIASAPPSAICNWSFGDGSTASACGSVTHTFDIAGEYDVSLTTTTLDGCTSTSANTLITVTALPEAEFTFSPQVLTVENTEVDFTNLSDNADSFEWNFADDSPINSEFEPTHEFPSVPGEYIVTLTAYNSAGTCQDQFQKLIVVEDVILFYIPNVFTPDGDAYNEIWKPVFLSGYDPYDYHLTLFNKWGEIVFESYNADYGWDGHFGTRGLVEDGVYVWRIEFKETMSDKRHEHHGHVTILK